MSPEFLQPFDHSIFSRLGVEVAFLRLDLIDPLISGNKWFKLQPLLDRRNPKQPILSFGGAYSNHLHALARFGQQHGIKTYGVVRGEPRQTATLEDAQNWGMRLHFVGRQSYRDLRGDAAVADHSASILSELHRLYGDFYTLPEGGATKEALSGCSKIWSLLPTGYRPDRVLVSVGTGTTLAGLVLGAPEKCRVEGVAAIGEASYLVKAIEHQLIGRKLSPDVSWSLDAGVALRFAKLNSELSGLWHRVALLGIELDPVYTLRMLHYFLRKLHSDQYVRGEKLLLVHTGGLQGLRGQQQRLSHLASAHCGPMPL